MRKNREQHVKMMTAEDQMRKSEELKKKSERRIRVLRVEKRPWKSEQRQKFSEVPELEEGEGQWGPDPVKPHQEARILTLAKIQAKPKLPTHAPKETVFAFALRGCPDAVKRVEKWGDEDTVLLRMVQAYSA